jgi:2-keto-4-pentenoate hydratase/2-oxohepta-3-ene-1,7-dioic acid hydratase in catechol pathway
VRVARFRHNGMERTGLVRGDEIAPVGGGVLEVLASRATEPSGPGVAVADVDLLAPIERPPKFLAIGLNYADHLAETGMEAPSFPVFFNKQRTCVIGPHDAIHVPRVSDRVDYEGELGIVIGQRCRHVPAARAPEVIAGFTVINDVTVRDWQMKSPTMTLGKSFDTHGPTGPWVVSADEVPDPHDLQIRTWVNGELMQDASTKEMIFDCYEQIATLSTSFTLEPGDLISTGTPAGVGFVRTPPIFLKAGDTVRIEIDGMGAIENPVIDEPADTVRLPQ